MNLKLYFDGKKLVKMITNINKQDQVMDIIEVSKEVPMNLFDVPMDYKIDNLR